MGFDARHSAQNADRIEVAAREAEGVAIGDCCQKGARTHSRGAVPTEVDKRVEALDEVFGEALVRSRPAWQLCSFLFSFWGQALISRRPAEKTWTSAPWETVNGDRRAPQPLPLFLLFIIHPSQVDRLRWSC